VATDSFLVEDFIASITAQLDEVQDALVFKSLNRPLTYALKDLTLELKVFVEMDQQGRVRFRTSGANEAGASVVHLGFTTITKPMIEENTVSMALTRSPSLEEAGLSSDEARRLERLGVRNVAQLQRLKASAGTDTVSRVAELTPDRIKRALAAGKPRVDVVAPAPPPKPAPQPQQPPPRPLPQKQNPIGPIRAQPGTKLDLKGRNLVGENGPPIVRLGNRMLSVSDADDNRVVIDLPHDAESGALAIELPDGETVTYALDVQDAADEWAPWGNQP